MRQTTTTLSAIVVTLALIVATATAAFAASSVDQMTLIDSSNGDLGSGALEWSGATYNADRNVILTVDDEQNAYELDLTATGTIDTDEPVRVLTISIGASDFEGVAWISGERYALLSEGSGVAYIVDIPLNSNTITSAHIAWQFTAGGPQGNTGSEGIAIDADGNFYVTDEMPASISKYDSSGNLVATTMLPALGDATGVVVAEDDTYVVISHESAKAVHYDIDWDTTTPTQLAEINLSGFSQLEGIAAIANSDLHLFGELKSGQTYAHYNGEIVAPSYGMLDVNCSGDVNIADALYIAHIDVGTSEPIEGCGTGDSNDDGATNIADALLIAQCEVGIANVACPG